MLSTATDYIQNALGKLGQMRPGYKSSPELLTEGLTEWQLMYDNYNATRTMQFTVPDFVYAVTGPGSAALATGQVLGMGFTIGQPFTFAGATTPASKTVLTPNNQGLEINQLISGTGIPVGTRITGVVPNVSITLSNAATASGTPTITVTADFTGPRPESIVRMNLWMTSAAPQSPTRIPLSPLSAEQWANIDVLQLTPINVTTVFYYEARFPFGVIWVWPPLNSNSLEMFTWGALAPPSALTSLYQAPPGYADVVVWNLASRLWHRCTRQVMENKLPHQFILGQAKLARDRVKAVNSPTPILANDFGGSRPANVGVSDWQLLLTGIPY